MSDPMQAPTALAPDATVTPTPTEARQDVRERVLDVILAHASTNAAYPISPRDLDAGRARAVALADAVIVAVAAPSPAPSAPDLDAIRAEHVYPSYASTSDEAWRRNPICSCGSADCPVVTLLAALAAAHAENEGAATAAVEALATVTQLTAERDEARAALAALREEYRDLATYRTTHANLGLCPEGPDDPSRDPDCPVCAALAAAPSETPRERVVRLSEDLAAGRAIHDPSGREVAPSETEEGR